MRYVAFTILLLISSVCSAFDPLDQYDAEAGLRYVCDVLELDCSNLPVPKIEYVNTCMRFGRCFSGMFHESTPNTIFMEFDTLTRGDRTDYSIMVHEITHYVDYHIGLTGMKEDRDYCETERLAFHVANLWAIENQVDPLWEWTLYYPACRPHVVR